MNKAGKPGVLTRALAFISTLHSTKATATSTDNMLNPRPLTFSRTSVHQRAPLTFQDMVVSSRCREVCSHCRYIVILMLLCPPVIHLLESDKYVVLAEVNLWNNWIHLHVGTFRKKLNPLFL